MTPIQTRLWRQCDALAHNEALRGRYRRRAGRVIRFEPTPRHRAVVDYMATIGDMSDEDAIHESERISAFGLDVFS